MTSHTCVDNVGPTVTAIDPSNGASSVAKDKTVVILFNEPMDTTSVAGALSIPGQTFTTIWSDNNKRLEIKGNPGWTYAQGSSAASTSPTIVTIAISNSAKDANGNPMSQFQSQFGTMRLIELNVGGNGSTGVLDPASSAACSGSVGLSSANILALVWGTGLTRTPDTDSYTLQKATLSFQGVATSGALSIDRIAYSPTSQTSWITKARAAGPLNFVSPSSGVYSLDVTSILYDGWITGSAPNMFRVYTTGSISVACTTASLKLLYLVP
jgi:hypothetical protein